VELSDAEPGDLIDLPFWPRRVTVEAIEDTWAPRTRLVRLFWHGTGLHEGVTTVAAALQVHRAGRFTDYATRPAYMPWTRTWKLFHPDPEPTGPVTDDALAALRAKLEGAGK
jgi:hypothetical protein